MKLTRRAFFSTAGGAFIASCIIALEGPGY